MSYWADATSEELVKAVVAGNRTAWTKLYLLWTPRIYGYFAARLFDDPASVDDLTQETMVAAWRALELRKKPPRQFDRWLFRIAHNKFNGYIKARKPTNSTSCWV